MYIIIVNPVSGNGRAMKVYRDLMGNSTYNHLKFETFYTEYIGHAEEITRTITNTYNLSDITTIIVLGGDGTLHEVVNGLDDMIVPISFIACGSGNDFARGANITRNPVKAMQHIYPHPKQTHYWIGKYQNRDTTTRKFVNSIGFGFDAAVARNANQSRFKKILNTFKLGTINYLFAVFKVIFTFNPMRVTLEMDGKTEQLSQCFLIIINNQPYVGGGMKINPQAKNESQKFSILTINAVSKWKIICLLGTVFTGYHTRFKEVRIYNASNITIRSEVDLPYQVDGETALTNYCEITKEKESVKIKGVS